MSGYIKNPFTLEEPAGGRTGKPKPESISDTEKPKANGKNGIETKMSQNEDIEALMPKLRHNSYYYTKPTMEQLAARERADPGYIGRVKDFVVGCDGAGSIRFLGEIDLRGLELESFIEIVPEQLLPYCYSVHGIVEAVKTCHIIWDDSMYYIIGEGTSKTKDMSDENLLWKRTMPPANLTRYNLTSFAITLNELTPVLKEKLPPTDSRLRPDQRHLENGEYDMANAEKLRLETRQRMPRKLQENGWKPRWFHKDGEDGTYPYGGGYWEKREEWNWEDCPNIFGEFSEDIVNFTI